ncbi:glutamate--cysteine ligase [Pseudonocardia sp. K10HN5]|uniref:Glutamate--cysteine ligase n=2 Tax=Pseudonocardia acidicola TaxID=2724939 RepID=A0ABX1S2S6_9PSEU|nr:glutamate-cysteine ligase family protein [Pseudonocardia acidicola]NMH95846.1 glutamate--cysteine ligase [Pseudonocardia acidicola]
MRLDGSFADFTDTGFDELQAIVDALPEDPGDYPDLRVGDLGIKRKRWYVEGFERFDEAGELLRCDPKGIEIRTRIHVSIDDAVAALRADQALLDAEALARGFRTTAIGFNPVRSSYPIVPPLNGWEHVHRTGSPEERTAHLHMVTYGPDLNLSCPGMDVDELIDVAAKLTFYSPYLVPLSFSSPLRDGGLWGGLSARTALRTGARPAVMVFLADPARMVPADPSLTQPARLPAEAGRIEFKAFDACPDPQLYGELLSLLTGLVLDTRLTGRRTTPDTALHQRSAREGLADPLIRAGAVAAVEAATAALAGRPADLARMAALRARLDRGECPALDMIARYDAGKPVAGICRARTVVAG